MPGEAEEEEEEEEAELEVSLLFLVVARDWFVPIQIKMRGEPLCAQSEFNKSPQHRPHTPPFHILLLEQ